MDKKVESKIKEFAKACRKVGEYGLLRCSSGNMSVRLEDELVAISSAGAWLSEITTEQVAICQIKDAECINGLKPTIESYFHLGVLRKRLDVNVVLHFQSPYATAIACGEPDKYNYSVIIEIPYYKLDKPGIVEYHPPGSDTLADAVINALAHSNIAILRNHGLVTIGKNYDDAIKNACFFELACQILCAQNKPVSLTQKQVEVLKKV